MSNKDIINWSHSARSAWIETILYTSALITSLSHSARSAWIETFILQNSNDCKVVALRKECVD